MGYASPPTAGTQSELAAAIALAQRIVGVLSSGVHRGQRERQIQDSIEKALLAADVAGVRREFSLWPKNRPDFFIADCVVNEVKMRASSGEVLWQLGRYAEGERVRAIVIATPRFSSLSRMPRAVHQVPIFPVALRGPGLSL